MELSLRHWVLIQQALVLYGKALADYTPVPWDDLDGDYPTDRDVDEAARALGELVGDLRPTA